MLSMVSVLSTKTEVGMLVKPLRLMYYSRLRLTSSLRACDLAATSILDSFSVADFLPIPAAVGLAASIAAAASFSTVEASIVAAAAAFSILAAVASFPSSALGRRGRLESPLGFIDVASGCRRVRVGQPPEPGVRTGGTADKRSETRREERHWAMGLWPVR